MQTQDERRGQHTLREIVSQPDGWAAAYDRLVSRRDEIVAAWAAVQPQQIVVTGCGSTNYLSQTVAALLQSLTGLPARGLPASEIALFSDQVLYQPEKTL